MAGKGLKFAAAVGAASAAMAAFAAIKFIKDSSKAAADFEKMAVGFNVLLGSAEKAQARMAAIQKMSMATPFEPKELIEASKTLQALGGDTAAIGDGLDLVGDAAAATGKDLQTIADNVGLLFQGLTAGGEVAEAGNQLMKMGALLPDVKGKITDLVAAMRKGDRAFMTSKEALELIQTGFVKTAGGMAKLADTVGGKASTMRGNLDMLRIAFGTGINKGLATGLDAMNDTLPEWLEKSKELGDTIGLGISEAIKGNTRMLELQMAWLMQKLAQIGGAVFVQSMAAVIRSVLPDLIESAIDHPISKAMGRLPGIKASQEIIHRPGAKYMRGTPQVPLEQLIESAGSVVGIGETEKKIAEMAAELVRVREAIEKAPVVEKKDAEEAAITSTVFGGVTYHHAR